MYGVHCKYDVQSRRGPPLAPTSYAQGTERLQDSVVRSASWGRGKHDVIQEPKMQQRPKKFSNGVYVHVYIVRSTRGVLSTTDTSHAWRALACPSVSSGPWRCIVCVPPSLLSFRLTVLPCKLRRHTTLDIRERQAGQVDPRVCSEIYGCNRHIGSCACRTLPLWMHRCSLFLFSLLLTRAHSAPRCCKI